MQKKYKIALMIWMRFIRSRVLYPYTFYHPTGGEGSVDDEHDLLNHNTLIKRNFNINNLNAKVQQFNKSVCYYLDHP